jgi:hypothetical protein
MAPMRKQIKQDSKKLKALILYVCSKGQGDKRFGAIKLNKILFFSDFYSYQVRGEPITGAKYVKQRLGPVPKSLMPIQQELVDEGRLEIRDVTKPWGSQREYQVKEPPDLSLFDSFEISTVDSIAEYIISDFTSSEASDLSHDSIWKVAKDWEEIPYSAVFAKTTGELTESDIQWAMSRIAK